MKSCVLLANEWGGIGGAECTAAFIAQELEQFGTVELLHGKPDFSKEVARSRFGMNLNDTTFRQGWPVEPVWNQIWNPWSRRLATRTAQRPISESVDIFVAITHYFPPFAAGTLNILHMLFPFDDPWWHGKKTDPHGKKVCSVATPFKAAFHALDIRARLATYQVHTANSEFSRDWAYRRWGRSVDWEVWNPPIELVGSAHSESEFQSILAVGRISPEKQPIAVIECFRQVAEVVSHAKLTIAGSSSQQSGSHEERLRKCAFGLNVEFRPNISIVELQNLYRSAGIFWHLMGWGVPEERPEYCEHFGMTTVEAMSAGCVPVVFGRGGQVEIVEHGISGFIWNSASELVAYTKLLMNERQLRVRMAAAAQSRAVRFGKDVFRRKLLDAVDLSKSVAKTGSTAGETGLVSSTSSGPRGL